MPVSKEITRLEQSNVRMTLTIPKEDVAAGYRAVLADYSQKVQIPGFRRGKAPPAVVERKLGEAALKGEALGKILEGAVEEAFAEENLPPNERPLPYSRPKMEDEPKFDLENDLVISLSYDVRPSFCVGRWQGLEVEVPTAEISDGDVERELGAIRERNSFVLDRDDDAKAREGDIVTISYVELGEGGEALPDTGRDDVVYVLGSGKSAYMYDDEIVGMAKGETKEFERSFPEAVEGGEAPDLAGQTVRLRLSLTAVKERRLPDLDDEFAQDVDEKFGTLDDLKKSLRDRLEADLRDRLRELRIGALMDKVIEDTPIVLPESMIDAEIGGRLGALGRGYGMDAQAVMRMLSASGGEEMRAKMRPSVEKALRSNLIAEALIEERGVEADDGELAAELKKAADAAGISEGELRERHGGAQIEAFRRIARERKFFDLLLAENSTRDGARVSYLDLTADNG